MVFQGLIDRLRFAWHWGHMYSRHRRTKTKLTVYFKLWKPGRAWKKGLNVDKIILCWWIKRKSGGFLFSYTARYLHQRIAEHENSAIGKHFSIAHGDASLLRESQFGILKKISRKIWLSFPREAFHQGAQSRMIPFAQNSLFVWKNIPSSIVLSNIFKTFL